LGGNTPRSTATSFFISSGLTKRLNSSVIGIDKSEVVNQKNREAKPYKILKIKVGGPNDEAMINTLRSVASDKSGLGIEIG